MTDDLPPDERDQSDERDEQVAALLEVPPLDDVTRRRLVTRALDDADARRAPSRRLARLLVPAAAALVALVLAGVGVFALVNRDGGDTTDAARSRTPDATSPSGGERTPDESDTAETAAGVRDLGDVGDVSDPGDLRRAVRSRLDQPPPAPRAAPPACLERAVSGTPTPSAYGTGTHRGRPVLVLVLPASGDRSTAVLLDTGTCRAALVADLP
jgi:hypothetical protein